MLPTTYTLSTCNCKMIQRSCCGGFLVDMAWELVYGDGSGMPYFVRRRSRNRDVLVSYQQRLHADLERRYG
jgi:hypothetical protein